MGIEHHCLADNSAFRTAVELKNLFIALTICMLACLVFILFILTKTVVMAEIQYISQEDFAGYTLKLSGLSIVECYINPSGPLQIMEPIFYRLKNESGHQFIHLRLDMKLHPFIKEKFYILREPTYLIFLEGVLIDKLEGLTSFNSLNNTISKHINETKNNE